MSSRTFRFAPSPNGYLHVGHARSALLNWQLAADLGGECLLRIEDIDTIRARPDYVNQITDDLAWLGLDWPKPVMVQSERFEIYSAALERLKSEGLVYPCFATRSEIRSATRLDGPRDPDGGPIYPGLWRHAPQTRIERALAEGKRPAWRLDLEKAVRKVDDLGWEECSPGLGSRRMTLAPFEWGDFIVGRRDIGTSYHLAVVVDDAAQGISDIVRGEDLKAATIVHRLLQVLLDLPEPRYWHHKLIKDEAGDKLAKSRGSASLKDLRSGGATPQEVREAARLQEAWLNQAE